MENMTVYAHIILPNEVIQNGALNVKDGRITYVGEASGATQCGKIYHFEDKYLAPGYVDIHCHASRQCFAHDDPCAVAEYHLSHGSTGMLETIYRNVPHEKMLSALYDIKDAMTTHPNILGAHLEGPYLNPMYGTGSGGKGDTPDEKKYTELAKVGIVRQWTYAPEVEGTEKFCKDIVEYGIVPAIGHSKASYEQIKLAEDSGACIVTHLFDATGCAIEPSSVAGTKEVNFDNAVLLCDNFSYEIICDKKGIHVRPQNVKLAIKTVGIDKIIGITDSYLGPDDPESDVTFIGNDLSGSKLTMDGVAKNFRALGLSLPDVFKVCSLNPAKAIGYGDSLGSLETGKLARMLILDENLEIVKIFI